jgi:hypothetical protein
VGIIERFGALFSLLSRLPHFLAFMTTSLLVSFMATNKKDSYAGLSRTQTSSCAYSFSRSYPFYGTTTQSRCADCLGPRHIYHVTQAIKTVVFNL